MVRDVRCELRSRVDAAVEAGVDAGNLILDPGLGFAKRAEHNWDLLAHFDSLTTLGLPVLVGASRKSFLGSLLAGPDGAARPSAGREDATTALTMFAALNGAYIAPYGTPTGQLALALIAALVIACLLWMRRLTTPPRAPRFLTEP